jgi:hypothetical protein
LERCDRCIGERTRAGRAMVGSTGQTRFFTLGIKLRATDRSLGTAWSELAGPGTTINLNKL